VHLCAFDLLELDGRDLRPEPLVERRRLLAKLARKPRCGLALNAQFDHDGALVFEHACLLGCEGTVSKQRTRAIVPAARAIGLRSGQAKVAVKTDTHFAKLGKGCSYF
jgi:ATP-dependent DNA ligase